MRKIRWICGLLVTMMLTLLFPSTIAFAEDDGYYIKNMKVDVQVFDNRQYVVTETIDVHFNEDRHGIIRAIPYSSSAEEYSIDNITIDGAPYNIENYYDRKEIKIGDPDETLNGDKRYIIKYTLTHYADYETDGDYLYLDVLGSEWDTKIENFESTIKVFNEANIKGISITSGAYGSRDNKLVTNDVKDNVIKIKSKGVINSNQAVTINAKLQEGAFKNAPVYVYPVVIQNEDINIEITPEKEYLVKRKISLTVNDEVGAYLPLWNTDYKNNELVRDIKVNSADIGIGESDHSYISFLNGAGNYDFEISYKVTPKLSSDIKFIFGPDSNEIENKGLNITIKSPFSIDGYNSELYNKGVIQDSTTYDVKNIDNKIIEFRTHEDILTNGNIRISLNIDKTLFSRPISLGTMIFMGLSIVILLVIIVIYFIFGKEKTLTPVIGFYPPRGLNSAEVGYIINNYVSSEDVTSLIFYWASEGYLKINIKDKEKFVIEKVKDIGTQHKEYEKSLFNQLFRLGKNGKVTNSQLKGSLYGEISQTQLKIRNFYTKEKVLNDSKASRWSGLSLFLSEIPLIGLGIAYIIGLNGDALLGGILGYSAGVIIYGIIYSIFRLVLRNKYKNNSNVACYISMGIVGVIFVSILSILSRLSDVDLIVSSIIGTVSYLSMSISVLMQKKTDYGRVLMEEIIGFKNFLEVAEKERIEMLLEQDPEYFYKTLPFANVLGVTKLWSDKFKDITMQPPSWYNSYDNYHGYAMMYAMNKSMRQIGDQASYNPQFESSGSDSSGGFSGGGFSGGGSGGGGGSSW